MKRIGVLLVCLGILCACGPAEPVRERVRIAMAEPAGMTDASTNAYRLWLEEQSGLDIELELVAPHYMEEYVRLLFSGGGIGLDAVFFGPESAISPQQIAAYGEQGLVAPLDGFVTPETELDAAFARFSSYDLRRVMTARDGHLYYMPNLDYSESLCSGQTLWVNAAWLASTGVTIPGTTEQFREMLLAFRAGDPNGDGQANDVPVASCFAQGEHNILYFLMNAFVYTDPENAFLGVENGEVFFAPATPAWREGLRYCQSLYAEDLLGEHCFTFSQRQFTRLVGDGRDVVGSFTAHAIADVLPPGSPMLYSRFVHVPPLKGPEGTRLGLAHTSLPTPGGIILASSSRQEAAFALMDLMLSEEAYLAAAFGRQGEDWDFAGMGDIGFDGNPATVSVKSNEWDLVENKHFAQSGPFISYPRYGDGVAWNGYQADQRYLNARAARVYREFQPREYIRALLTDEETAQIRAKTEAYVQESMVAFITGQKDLNDEDVWLDYLAELERLGLARLMEAARYSYHNTAKEAM